jgi:small-conductance mechanosensitive channel
MLFRALAAILLVSLSLQAQGPLTARLAATEAMLAAHYRGEPRDVARAKSNAAIEAFNARVKSSQTELDTAKAALDRELAPARKTQADLRDQIKALDVDLKEIPDGNDKQGNARYQAKVQVRKGLMGKINPLIEEENRVLDGYNAKVRQIQTEQAALQAQVRAEREAVDLRVAAFETFAKGGGDLAFFTEVNRLLVEARKAGDAAALSKVRAQRRELGEWAMAYEARSPHGLIVLEVRLGDELAWLVLDTGASDVVVAPEVLEGAGISLAAGENNTFVVVGGQHLQGRAVRLPSLTVAGQVQTDLPATAVRPFQVGLDGLLGQTFLKNFVYTVDDRKPEKLGLVRKS